MKIIKILFSILIILELTSCQSMHHHDGTQPGVIDYKERTPNLGLTHEDAVWRSSVVSGVKYELNFNLSGDPNPDYTGESEIRFNLKSQETVTVDFAKGQILSLIINGAPVPSFTYNAQFLTLPKEYLKVGVNSVKIGFSHPYSTSGSGLYRFKDPEDGKTYVYTDLEPFDANKFFPCFDQPDLKATYKIKAHVPEDWTVISSVLPESSQKIPSSGQSLWVFRESETFSTYLISLHAGPYKMWSATAGRIPVRLFARQSLAKYVNEKDWLKFTGQGLKFYQSYFGIPYPFKKFDEIIVPDYNHGAMENVAAITFAEKYIKRGKMTQADREDIASVLLHEMAHMWFGDLVTMKWWNDIWLNESFATFASSLAQSSATEFKRSWLTFFLSEKEWAYFEDQLVTTHPIEYQTANTDVAFANFDGITYGKGASVLKQLSFYVGADAFKNGVSNYLKKYRYKNATLEDFMQSLQGSTPLNLKKWKSDWLQTAGLNTVEAKFSCKDGKVIDFSLLQRGFEGSGILRSHRTQIGLFSRDMYGNVKLQRTVSKIYSGAETPIAEVVGDPCPVLVHPNFGDQDYVKVKLDPITFATSKFQLSKVGDPLSRALFWSALWAMVREADLSPQTYAGMIFDHLPSEKEFKTVDNVLKTIFNSRLGLPSLLKFLRSQNTGDIDAEKVFRSKLEKFAEQGIDRGTPGSDLSQLYFDLYVNLAYTPEAQEKLKSLLVGTLKKPGIEIDQDRRWKIIIKLSSLGVSEAGELLQKEKKADPSSEGVKSAFAADASRPLLEVKQIWLDKFVGPNDMGFSQMRTVMRNLFPLGQEELKGQEAGFFFSNIGKIKTDKDPAMQEEYTSDLVPNLCNEASVNALKNYLGGNPDLTPIMVKKLRVSLQEDERCMKVRKLAGFTNFR